MSTQREPIGVIGTGYVGLVTAAGFAELGNEVWCIDIDAAKIERLEGGEIPIYEPGLAELVAKHRGRLHFSTDIADALEHARLLFVAVGHAADLLGRRRPQRRARGGQRDAALRHARARHEVDRPGGHRHVDQAHLRRAGQGGLPLRLVPGVPQGGLGGARLPASPTASSSATTATGPATPWSTLYAPLGAPLVRTDIASAEMIKLAANAFLATKISFINEIANVCEVTGANVIEVARGIGLDDRIGPKFLQAGVGFGGSCFPKDVTALKQLAGNSGYHFQLLNAVIEVNELQKRRVMAKLEKHLGTLVGKRGRAARPGLQAQHRRHARGDVARAQRAPAGRRREGPRLRPGRRGRGAQADAAALEFADDALSAVDGADAAVLVTEWDEFKELDFGEVAEAMSGKLVIDGRNALDPEAVRAAGLTYEGIGRS